jgi:hypothetical protein
MNNKSSVLTDCFWDYENIPSASMPLVELADRRLSLIIMSLDKIFNKALKIGKFRQANRPNDEGTQYVYTYCNSAGTAKCYLSVYEDVMGDLSYKLIDTRGKVQAKSKSYNYFCKAIFKAAPNLKYTDTSHYENILTSIESAHSYFNGGSSDVSLYQLKESVSNIAADLSPRQLHGMANATLGGVSSVISPEDEQRYIALRDATNRYCSVNKLFIDSFLSGDKYIVAKVESEFVVIDSPPLVPSTYPKSMPYHSSWYRSAQSFNTPQHASLLARFAMLHAHTGYNVMQHNVDALDAYPNSMFSYIYCIPINTLIIKDNFGSVAFVFPK